MDFLFFLTESATPVEVLVIVLFGVPEMDVLISGLFVLFGFCVVLYWIGCGISLLWAYSPALTVLAGIAIFVVCIGGGDGTDIGGHV